MTMQIAIVYGNEPKIACVISLLRGIAADAIPGTSSTIIASSPVIIGARR